MSWEVLDEPYATNVLPDNDLIEHTHNEKCFCSPKVKLHGHTCWHEDKPTLSVNKLIVHNAMDGRED